MATQRMPTLLTILLIALLLYLIVAAGMFLMQRKLLYLPNASPAYPKEQGLEQINLLRLATQDGETLIAWYVPAEAGYPTLAYFHGNAGNLQDRTDKYRLLTDKGFGLLALSYRGYGGSTGSPSEAGLMEDARTAIRHLLEEKGLTADQLILYGESLGSGVATRMATEFSPAGLILEAPYTSVANRAQELYPFLPVHWLLKDTFDSLSLINNLPCPLLILHGDADKVIPIAHGKALLAAAPEPKEGIFFPGIGHVDFNWSIVADNVHDFAEAQGLLSPSTQHPAPSTQ